MTEFICSSYSREELAQYLSSIPSDTGVLLQSYEAGVKADLCYEKGKLKDAKKYKGIKGIPDEIKSFEELQELCLQVLISFKTEHFIEINNKLKQQNLPVFHTLEDMVSIYLERGIPEELKAKEIYAKLVEVIPGSGNVWQDKTRLIVHGFHMPEYLELVYGSVNERIDFIEESYHSLSRKKRYNKTEAVYLSVQNNALKEQLICYKL